MLDVWIGVGFCESEYPRDRRRDEVDAETGVKGLNGVDGRIGKVAMVEK